MIDKMSFSEILPLFFYITWRGGGEESIFSACFVTDLERLMVRILAENPQSHLHKLITPAPSLTGAQIGGREDSLACHNQTKRG